MNTENLKCFILVAETLSFSRTAEALYISQPAVTKQINSLENELGVSLFIRSTHHVELTPQGMAFYNDAKEIVNKSYQAAERIKNNRDLSDNLSIGVSNPTILNYVSRIIKEFHISCPNIHPNIEVLNHNTILNLFNENKIDALFFYKENFTSKSKVKFKKIYEDSLFCLVSENHRIANSKSISIENLKNENIILCNPINAPIATSKFQRKILKQLSLQKTFYCNSIEIAHCMVSAEIGITILPGLLCPNNPPFQLIELQDSPKLSFGCFYYEKNKNKELKKLLKIL